MIKSNDAGPALSVAMCTYNGERFLAPQLASILRQTRLPDELVICDDRSTDATADLIQAFARTAPFPVRLIVNERNLGSTRNFEQAIAACHGNLIALSDQDDVWHAHRLERSQQEFIQHPEAGLIFSNADVIDDLGQLLPFTLWENFAFDQSALDALQGGDLQPFTKRTYVTGATVMFRAAYAPLCFPTGQHWLHDGWLAMLIAAMSNIRAIDEKLIAYRFHSSQQVGLGPEAEEQARRTLEEQSAHHSSNLAAFHVAMEEICAAIERLPLTMHQRTEGTADTFRRHRDFLALRLSLPQSRMARLPVILQAVEQYRRSSMGALSMLKDLALPKPL